LQHDDTRQTIRLAIKTLEVVLLIYLLKIDIEVII
ncbi:hypothetical protein BAE44_0014515, partial [Dichanthelium oligosanthes]